MTDHLDEVGVAWLPDGIGLDDHSQILVTEFNGRVHLRLTPSNGRYPIPACHGRPGDWWTGVPAQVNCPDCLEWMHA